MSRDETRDPGPWCTVCGAPGLVSFVGLQTARPIGVCQRGAPDRKGCGRVILTRIRAEAYQVADARARRLATSHHWQHLDDQGRPHLNALCASCAAMLAEHERGTTARVTSAPADAPEARSTR